MKPRASKIVLFALVAVLLLSLNKLQSSFVRSPVTVCCVYSIYREERPFRPLEAPKGQIISECLFDFFEFSKTNEKFDKFLPKNLKSGQIIK